VQKGASVPSRRFELPRTATSPSRSRPRFSGHRDRQSDQLDRAFRRARKSGHHPSDSPVNILGFGGHHPSETSVTFRRNTQDNGTKVIRLPPLSPNLNAHAERFVRSIKDECLDRMIFVGQATLRRAVDHYLTERNHQGLNNRLIRGTRTVAANDGFVHRRARLGGMLNYYYRAAA